MVDPLDIALIVIGVAVVFLGMVCLTMHILSRDEKNFQDPDPIDVNDKV